MRFVLFILFLVAAYFFVAVNIVDIAAAGFRIIFQPEPASYGNVREMLEKDGLHFVVVRGKTTCPNPTDYGYHFTSESSPDRGKTVYFNKGRICINVPANSYKVEILESKT